MVVTDATVITESGYAGDDAEVLIHKLFQLQQNIIKKNANMVLYMLMRLIRKQNVMTMLITETYHEGVQQSSLKLMEGTVVSV